jgi:hypothetical protein
MAAFVWPKALQMDTNSAEQGCEEKNAPLLQVRVALLRNDLRSGVRTCTSKVALDRHCRSPGAPCSYRMQPMAQMSELKVYGLGYASTKQPVSETKVPSHW